MGCRARVLCLREYFPPATQATGKLNRLACPFIRRAIFRAGGFVIGIFRPSGGHYNRLTVELVVVKSCSPEELLRLPES